MVAVWVLCAQGSMESKKTSRGKPHLHQILVADAACTLRAACRGKEGSKVAIICVAAARDSGAPNGRRWCPEPIYTGLEQLVSCHWRLRCHLGQRNPSRGGTEGFKIVDSSGLCLRIHFEKQLSAPEGASIEVLMAQKSSRFSNASITESEEFTLPSCVDFCFLDCIERTWGYHCISRKIARPCVDSGSGFLKAFIPFWESRKKEKEEQECVMSRCFAVVPVL